jgi:GNAT superfamily N-acetyltransferase
MASMETRSATTRDVDRVTECITLAFATDPVWEPALRRTDGSTDHHEAYWRLFVEDAVEQGSVSMAPGGEAVAVWIPPGGVELSPARLDAFESMIGVALDAESVADLHALFDRFEASRAPLGPHYYLSLLATHPDHRGRGIGQGLLASDLARWDRDGDPSYLESTNAANDHRYVRAGFRPIGGFETVREPRWVTAMWREVGGQPD